MTVKLKPAFTNNQVFVDINNLPSTVKRAIRNGLQEIGSENIIYAKQKLYSRKTGRVYLISGQRHQASAPYEFPASITGNLARHLKYVVRGSSQMEFGDKKMVVPYGKFLEGGTIKMKPRPHVGQTVKERFKEAHVSLVTATKRELGVV